jgi:uncharacterized membrane protein
MVCNYSICKVSRILLVQQAIFAENQREKRNWLFSVAKTLISFFPTVFQGYLGYLYGVWLWSNRTSHIFTISLIIFLFLVFTVFAGKDKMELCQIKAQA